MAGSSNVGDGLTLLYHTFGVAAVPLVLVGPACTYAPFIPPPNVASVIIQNRSNMAIEISTNDGVDGTVLGYRMVANESLVFNCNYEAQQNIYCLAIAIPASPVIVAVGIITSVS
jgi:hypothetical protein